jgi:hypothetical protein
MRTRVISYQGMVAHAVLDLVDWVERGIEPPASTSYRLEHGQLEFPDSASARQGLQPVVTATANGEKRVEVAVGDEVLFEAFAETPSGGGYLVAVDWDFDGSGLFAHRQGDLGSESTSLRRHTTHRFDEPGTYFPAVRVVALRSDSEDWSDIPETAQTPLLPTGLENLDRVRVVVSSRSTRR